MAKAKGDRIIIQLQSTEGPVFRHTSEKNRRNDTGRWCYRYQRNDRWHHHNRR